MNVLERVAWVHKDMYLNHSREKKKWTLNFLLSARSCHIRFDNQLDISLLISEGETLLEHLGTGTLFGCNFGPTTCDRPQPKALLLLLLL